MSPTNRKKRETPDVKGNDLLGKTTEGEKEPTLEKLRRTREGTSTARAKKKRGEPVGRIQNLTQASRLKGAQAQEAAAHYHMLSGYMNVLREGGKTFREIAAKLNVDGYRTRTGAEFAGETVRRAMRRARLI